MVRKPANERTAITLMLDEIARLRKVLEQYHMPQCRMLRENVACTCGAAFPGASAITEVIRLRAQVESLENLVRADAAEIMRLDLEVLRCRVQAKGTPSEQPSPPSPPQREDD